MPYRWFGCSSHDTDDVRFLRITFDFSFVTDLSCFGIAPWSCWIVPRDRLRVHEVICSCELPSNFDIDELDRLIGVCPSYVCTASSCRCICSCVAGISNSSFRMVCLCLRYISMTAISRGHVVAPQCDHPLDGHTAARVLSDSCVIHSRLRSQPKFEVISLRPNMNRFIFARSCISPQMWSDAFEYPMHNTSII